MHLRKTVAEEILQTRRISACGIDDFFDSINRLRVKQGTREKCKRSKASEKMRCGQSHKRFSNDIIGR